MRKHTKLSLVFAVAFSGIASAGIASASSNPSDLGYSAIQQGQWQSAEAQLRAELEANPNDPMRMLNLAYVLQSTGREAEAKALYESVLQLSSNPMVAVGPDRNVKGMPAKSVARRGIAALEASAE